MLPECARFARFVFASFWWGPPIQGYDFGGSSVGSPRHSPRRLLHAPREQCEEHIRSVGGERLPGGLEDGLVPTSAVIF
jgi:hypothetical protein